MSSLKPPSSIESVAGSLPVQGVLTAVAVCAADVMQGGGPAIAALLPVLATTLAANRQSERIQSAIATIDAGLREHADKLAELSDSQYKLINEAVAAMFSTTCQAKIELLQKAALGVLDLDDLPSHQAVLLGRILRDISFEEFIFLKQNFICTYIELADKSAGYKGNVGTFSRASNDGVYASGLVSLGMLIPSENTYDKMGLLSFSPLCVKLLALLKS